MQARERLVAIAAVPLPAGQRKTEQAHRWTGTADAVTSRVRCTIRCVPRCEALRYLVGSSAAVGNKHAVKLAVHRASGECAQSAVISSSSTRALASGHVEDLAADLAHGQTFWWRN